MNTPNTYAQTLIDYALSLGATDAIYFEKEDIVYDKRTLLKCMFGCDDYGKGLTCPSRQNNASLDEYKEMLSLYQYGIIIHAHDKHISQKVSFALEQKAFLDGYYFAFSLSDCGLCKKCAGFDNLPCRNVKKARPAFHSVGIDVFKTVRQLGYPIDTLKEKGVDEQNWYSAVFVE